MQLGFGLGPDMSACWPADEDCKDFRKDAEKFMKEVQALSGKVMELLAEGVGLVRSLPDPSTSFLVLKTLPFFFCATLSFRRD